MLDGRGQRAEGRRQKAEGCGMWDGGCGIAEGGRMRDGGCVLYVDAVILSGVQRSRRTSTSKAQAHLSSAASGHAGRSGQAGVSPVRSFGCAQEDRGFMDEMLRQTTPAAPNCTTASSVAWLLGGGRCFCLEEPRFSMRRCLFCPG